MPRDNILVQKRPQPKLVKLPNGRSFYARHQRVNRGVLYHTKVRIKRTYTRKIGPRRQRKRKQQRGGYVNSQNLMRRLNLAKRGANTEFGKTVTDDAISLLPKPNKSLKHKVFGRKKKEISSAAVLPNSNHFVFRRTL